MAHAAKGATWCEFAQAHGVSEQGISRAAGILGVTGWDVSERARESVLAALGGGLPMTTAAVAAGAGTRRQQTKHALQALCSTGRVRQRVHKCQVDDVSKPWALYTITPAGLAELARTAPRKVA